MASEWGSKRPVTFGDCADKPDPCPWISCKYHMLLDINPHTGSLKFNVGAVRSTERGQGPSGAGYRVRGNHPGISPRDMRGKQPKTLVAQAKVDDRVIELLANQRYSCVLKVVQNREPLTLIAVGEVMSLTRERVRQIQTSAESKLRAAPGPLGEA